MEVDNVSEFTLLDLGILKGVKDSGNNSLNNISLFKEIYNDENKNLKYYLIINNENKALLFKIDDSNNGIIKDEIVFKFDDNINLLIHFAYAIYLNKIFIVNSLSLVYMIDLDTKELYNIEIEEESVELCTNHSYVFVDTKIILSGGINKNNKLNKTMTSFDISIFKFSEEKVRENNFIPRHRHGSVALNEVIYVVGGFSSIHESPNNSCNSIQAIRFDNLMNNWLNVKVEGDQPEYLIDPQMTITQDNLIVFSFYLYPKLFILKNKNSTGMMINLSNLTLNKQIDPQTSIFAFENIENEKINSNILFAKENTVQIIKFKINF